MEFQDDTTLKYKYLNEFDKAMNTTEEKYGWLNRYGSILIIHDIRVCVDKKKNISFLTSKESLKAHSESFFFNSFFFNFSSLNNVNIQQSRLRDMGT